MKKSPKKKKLSKKQQLTRKKKIATNIVHALLVFFLFVIPFLFLILTMLFDPFLYVLLIYIAISYPAIGVLIIIFTNQNKFDFAKGGMDSRYGARYVSDTETSITNVILAVVFIVIGIAVAISLFVFYI